MERHWSVLATLRAGREQVRLGASEHAIGAIRALSGEVPAPVRDGAYFALLDSATGRGGQASIGMLAQPREATLALFDAAIGQLAGRLH
jgi:hypothetical protein